MIPAIPADFIPEDNINERDYQFTISVSAVNNAGQPVTGSYQLSLKIIDICTTATLSVDTSTQPNGYVVYYGDTRFIDTSEVFVPSIEDCAIEHVINGISPAYQVARDI